MLFLFLYIGRDEYTPHCQKTVTQATHEEQMWMGEVC